MNVGAILAQATEEGGAGIAGGALGSVYIAFVVVHGFGRSVRRPQVGAIAGIIPLRSSGRLHARPVCRRASIRDHFSRVNDRRPRPTALEARASSPPASISSATAFPAATASRSGVKPIEQHLPQPLLGRRERVLGIADQHVDPHQVRGGGETGL